MASVFRVTAGNNHFGKSGAIFHSPRAVGGAHVKKRMLSQDLDVILSDEMPRVIYGR
jgi:hypothetical protein